MTKLKWICISISLTLLLSLAVGGGALNIDQKWSFGGGNQFGYEGGFCFPGLCIGGSGGSRYNYGWDRFNGRFRETMYCKPLSCWGGSCDALHLHLDKGLYKSLISKNTAKRNPSSTVDHIPETMLLRCANSTPPASFRLSSALNIQNRRRTDIGAGSETTATTYLLDLSSRQ